MKFCTFLVHNMMYELFLPSTRKWRAFGTGGWGRETRRMQQRSASKTSLTWFPFEARDFVQLAWAEKKWQGAGVGIWREYSVFNCLNKYFKIGLDYVTWKLYFILGTIILNFLLFENLLF